MREQGELDVVWDQVGYVVQKSGIVQLSHAKHSANTLRVREGLTESWMWIDRQNTNKHAMTSQK